MEVFCESMIVIESKVLNSEVFCFGVALLIRLAWPQWFEMCPPKLEKSPSFGVVQCTDALLVDSLLLRECSADYTLCMLISPM